MCVFVSWHDWNRAFQGRILSHIGKSCGLLPESMWRTRYLCPAWFITTISAKAIGLGRIVPHSNYFKTSHSCLYLCPKTFGRVDQYFISAIRSGEFYYRYPASWILYIAFIFDVKPAVHTCSSFLLVPAGIKRTWKKKSSLEFSFRFFFLYICLICLFIILFFLRSTSI